GLARQIEITFGLVDGADLAQCVYVSGLERQGLHVQVQRQVSVAGMPGFVATADRLVEVACQARRRTRIVGVLGGLRVARRVRLWRRAGAANNSNRDQARERNPTVSIGDSHDYECAKAWMSRMTAGPIATRKKLGKKQKIRGKIIFVPSVAAISSARCIRLSRNSSE